MSGSGGITPIIHNSGQRAPQKNIIDYISKLQRLSVAESAMSLPEDFYTLEDRIDDFVQGMRTALSSTIFLALLTPLSLGVLNDLIPVFGNQVPTLMDQIFVVYFMFGFTIAYGFLIASIRKYYVGTVCRASIRNLMNGVTTGTIIKIVVVFFLFHWIYYTLSPDNLLAAANWATPKIGYQRSVAIYYWLLNFRPVFLQSAYVHTAGSLLFILIPSSLILYQRYKFRKEENYVGF